MAAKTKTITVQVDERLASEIEGTTVHNWRTTTFASGKRRVYATFESVKTVGGMKAALDGVKRDGDGRNQDHQRSSVYTAFAGRTSCERNISA